MYSIYKHHIVVKTIIYIKCDGWLITRFTTILQDIISFFTTISVIYISLW